MATRLLRVSCDKALKPGLRYVRVPGFLYNQTKGERAGMPGSMHGGPDERRRACGCSKNSARCCISLPPSWW